MASSITSPPKIVKMVKVGKRPLPAKKRGSYNCGRCGLPKKGHVCTLPPLDVDLVVPPETSPRVLLPRLGNTRLRRALLFDDIAESPLLLTHYHQEVVKEEEEDEFVGVGSAGFVPLSSLVEVLKRVPVKGLLSAAAVCHGWRECVKRMWKSAEELRVIVARNAQIGFVESVLEKCVGLVRLSVRIER